MITTKHIPDGTHGNINVYRDKPGVIARSERGNRHVGFDPRTGLLVGSVFPDRYIVTNPEKLVVDNIDLNYYFEFDLQIDNINDILLVIDDVVYHPSFPWEFVDYGIILEGSTYFAVFTNEDPYVYAILELPASEDGELLTSGQCALYCDMECTVRILYEKSKNFVTFPLVTFPDDGYMTQGAEYDSEVRTPKSLVVIADGVPVPAKWSRKPKELPQYPFPRWECTHQYGRIVLECDEEKKIPKRGYLNSYKNATCEIQLTSRH